MKTIIETCPNCGADLYDIVITTYPPIRAKRCLQCNWSWEEDRDDIIRVPFDPDDNGLLTGGISHV